MSEPTILLPGDTIPPTLLPSPASTKPLTLGPGLRHIPPSTITAALSGPLHTDPRKNALWIENNGGRYIPVAGDLVICSMHHSSVDAYHCVITPYTAPATLPQLAFEGASKKTRPVLAPGALVYARISVAGKHMEPELECVHPGTGKAEGLGPLKGGMVWDVSLGMARRLLLPPGKMREVGGLVLLEALAEKVRFEVAVGRNGRVWVEGGSVGVTLAVGRAVIETDEGGLGVEEQRRLVARVLRGM
ncbi:hypothetical protein W97_05710 [Coniosporium apollinis CBS 100218]|uniref:Ribosomal RNA-processing protein 40 n=1 Tax=Coniosporium apollinis (strain CBS 100218) TaxID=1168221 RepID=R7YWN3_CONA1|nr:uncharacterized protein W97_05710 [Coniosporium apollinis CBS 100218]EON66317.1 hypothetical protein W97_05710 [Coniosporium apollinis CBS 100218]